jgi:hypothetical protein
MLRALYRISTSLVILLGLAHILFTIPNYCPAIKSADAYRTRAQVMLPALRIARSGAGISVVM